ncbi:MAG: DUF1178 family protein [Desulfobacterales bacterium]
MIAYDLCCENGHTFEGWFENAEAFRRQRQEGLVACPICNDSSINRLPSTFGIKSRPPAAGAPTSQASLDALGKRIADFVENHFENVGADFAKEALKIHYGASEPRNIRGVSSEEEEKTLRQEGVQFIKVPLPLDKEGGG